MKSKKPDVMSEGTKKEEPKASSTSTGSEVSSEASVKKEKEKERDLEPLLLKRGASGTVNFFSHRSNFGFIVVDGSEERIFVHANSILTFLPTIFCMLHEGDKVEFDIIKGVKGKEAVAVTGIGGNKIGSRRFGDSARRGTFSRFVPARARNGGGGGGGAGEGLADEVKKLAVADDDKTTGQDHGDKKGATSDSKEEKNEKRGEKQSGDKKEDKTERGTGAAVADDSKTRGRKQPKKRGNKKSSTTGGDKADGKEQ